MNIKIKFAPGESVWVMYASNSLPPTVLTPQVKEVRVVVCDLETTVEYLVFLGSEEGQKIISEDRLFGTKEELLNSFL